MFWNKYLKQSAVILFVALLIFLATQTKAVSVGMTFPSAGSFDPNAGVQISSDITDIAFLNILDVNGDSGSDLFVSNAAGEGGIITKEGTNFRTFSSIKLPEAPVAQLAADITGDSKPDLVSLIPPKLIGSKEWRYAKITGVAADHFVTDATLRKNALMQSTIIAPDGKQYQVKENNGSHEDGFIFLEKQLVPEPTTEEPLPDFNTFLHVDEYVAYLLPVQKITQNYNITVHKNSGENNNFEASNCSLYIPLDIRTITAMSVGDVNRDDKADLVLTTHNSEEMNVVSFPSPDSPASYDAASHTATLTMNIPPSQINGRDLRGSFFGFVNEPQTLFRIRDASASQIIVDFVLPDTGDGFETLKTALVPGDRIHAVLNDESSKKDLIYFGDGSGCFTYTGEMSGTIFESSFGKVVLPGASEVASESRSVITDSNNNFLPANSLGGRKLQIGTNAYTIEQNDQGHFFIDSSSGDITGNSPDILGAKTFTTYKIAAVDPLPTIDPLTITATTPIVIDVPDEIQALVGTFRLAEANPWIRPIDIDQDTDIDLIYIHDRSLFLKTNNERTP